MTARAARWATRAADAGRAVKELAQELGCDRHTVNATVTRWGRALLVRVATGTDGCLALCTALLLISELPIRYGFQ